MDYVIDTNGDFKVLWVSFNEAAYGLIQKRLLIPGNKFLSAFKHMFEETHNAVTNDKFCQELSTAFNGFEEDKNNKKTATLLRYELGAFITGYVNVTGCTLDTLKDTPSRKKWLSKKVTAKDMLKVGKTILESLIDTLGDLIPSWVKGILKTLKEVFDFVVG